MKCKHCDNEAVYSFECNGETVHVCESCDEDYNLCCGCETAIVYQNTRCQSCLDAEVEDD